MAKFRQLYHHTVFYTLANMIEALAPLLLIPLLTRHLSPHDYGLWTLFQSSVAVLIPLIGLGYKDAIRMRYLQISAREFGHFITAATFVTVAMALFAAGLFLALRTTLGDWFQLAPVGLLAMVVVAAGYSFFYMAIAICQFAGARRMFILLHVIQMAISLLATVVLIYGDVGWKGCVYGKLAGLSAACIVAACFLARRFAWCRSIRRGASHMRGLVHFGWRYLPYGLVFVVIPLTNRLLITHGVSMAEASFYALAESFAMALNLVIVGFMFAWQPWLFRKLAGQDADGMHSVLLSCILFVVALPFAGTFLTVASVVAAPYVLGPQFQHAMSYVFAMMMATAACGYFLLVLSFIHFRERIALMSCVAVIAMGMNALLSSWLVSYTGALGAAWGAAASYFIAALIGLAMALRIYRKPVPVTG